MPPTFELKVGAGARPLITEILWQPASYRAGITAMYATLFITGTGTTSQGKGLNPSNVYYANPLDPYSPIPKNVYLVVDPTYAKPDTGLGTAIFHRRLTPGISAGILTVEATHVLRFPRGLQIPSGQSLIGQLCSVTGAPGSVEAMNCELNIEFEM